MFSKEVMDNVANGSWIRAMFEQGLQLIAKYGAENVYDFTLGNPDPEPDPRVQDTIRELVSGKYPDIHKYMANAGYGDVREKVAQYTQRETGVAVTGDFVVMVAGAAAGLNAVLKALLNPGEEVLVSAPYFVEYKFYTENYGGRLVTVNALPDTFQLDLPAIKNAITPKTKALILNSPNNPSGAVYPEADLLRLAEILAEKEKEYGHPIYVISDEPYVKIVYDGVVVPPMPAIFKNSVVVNSFSKSLALPGERIGYVVVNPAIENAKQLVAGIIFSARVLGFVNAPSLFQKVVAEHLDLATGVDSYKERRDVLYGILREAGFECTLPGGAFYLFVKSPDPDDAAFAQAALRRNIIVVGGTGFGYPGYFRLAYCVSMETIKNSREAFLALGKEYHLK